MTRIFRETDSQVAMLESLNSSYRTSSENKDGRIVACVTLVDNVTKEAWHEATGQSHADALERALATARPGEKPKTPAEIAAESIALADENAKLRELVDQLKAQRSESAPPQEDPAAPATTRRRSGI